MCRPGGRATKEVNSSVTLEIGRSLVIQPVYHDPFDRLRVFEVILHQLVVLLILLLDVVVPILAT